ncbi:MAG: VWA domain-containing protein [Flavobacteriales bacterium]|nr:VWA domain-containing protein [Flavobacteriales bacterium]
MRVISVLIFALLLILVEGCFYKERSPASGWSYNDPGNGGFQRGRGDQMGVAGTLNERIIAESENGNRRNYRRSENINVLDGVYIQEHSEGQIANLEGNIEGQDDPNQKEQEYAFLENPFVSTLEEHTSTFSIDVDVASYAQIRQHIELGLAPNANIIRLEEMINYFDYDYPVKNTGAPFSFSTEISTCPWNPENKILHIGIKGKEVMMEQAEASNLVFLVDVSGSMSGNDRLGLIQKGLINLVKTLRKEDKISLVVYAGSSGLVLPPTSCDNKSDIINAIKRLKSGGSTAGAEGIELAYKTASENLLQNGNNRVILCTDGDFNVGISSQEALVSLIEEKRETGIFLSVLGVGMGNYQDQKMEQLADHGNGNYAFLDSEREAKKVLVEEIMGTLYAIAKDVKIQIDFDASSVKNYRLIGYQNRVLENKDFEDDKKDAGEIGAGHSVTALYEISCNEQLQELSEIAKLKVRYKDPDGATSKLLEYAVLNDNIPLVESTENFRFSAAVAGFGMMLGKSKYINDYTYKELRALASSAVSNDEHGYKAEFLTLLRQSKQLGL